MNEHFIKYCIENMGQPDQHLTEMSVVIVNNI